MGRWWRMVKFVVVNNKFGVRLTDVISTTERIEKLS